MSDSRDTRLLAAILLTLSAVACACGGMPADDNKPAAAQSEAAVQIAEAKRVIAAIAANRSITQQGLEAVLGVSLREEPGSGNPRIVAGAIASGPFGRAELRQSQVGHSIILEVRSGVALPYKGFRGDSIPEAVPPTFNPAIPPEGAMSFVVEGAGQKIHYQFGAEGQLLQSVALHRDGP